MGIGPIDQPNPLTSGVSPSPPYPLSVAGSPPPQCVARGGRSGLHHHRRRVVTTPRVLAVRCRRSSPAARYRVTPPRSYTTTDSVSSQHPVSPRFVATAPSPAAQCWRRPVGGYTTTTGRAAPLEPFRLAPTRLSIDPSHPTWTLADIDPRGLRLPATHTG